MASEVGIANRALQKLGAQRIVSLTDNSVNARACNACYAVLRDAELRKYRWNFSILRVELAADAVPPSFGRANSFQLPSDCIMPIPPYPEDNFNSRDWVIEGQKVLTDDSAPLRLRYISRVTDPNLMDPLFREALSASMAVEMTDELTQSNVKKTDLRQDHKDIIAEAKKANSFEKVSGDPPESTFVTVRR